jgi:hypothetical protein
MIQDIILGYALWQEIRIPAEVTAAPVPMRKDTSLNQDHSNENASWSTDPSSCTSNNSTHRSATGVCSWVFSQLCFDIKRLRAT